MSNSSVAIFWFRQDLRLADHPALTAAMDAYDIVIPIYIWAPEEEGDWAYGGAMKWWLHHSLEALQASLKKHDSCLILRQGDSLKVLQQLIEETGADAVYWSRRYEPTIIKRDTEIKKQLQATDITAVSVNSSLLWEPWEIKSKQETPYQVYTPYWKACLNAPMPHEPITAPHQIPGPTKWPASDKLSEWKLLPTLDWAKEFHDNWEPGESGAKKNLKRFLGKPIQNYENDRNLPKLFGTSGLSPHLHLGEISPHTIWHQVIEDYGPPDAKKEKSPHIFLSEIVWREFAHHLLFHFPHTPEQPLREKYASFPWKYSKKNFRAWTRGLTGYPIVDAGMRQLWRTGWMHNRVRMIVASFLTKDLLIRWQDGATWFWDTLVDADLANNTFGWQWTAGCGADAAPYFRIFHPVTQGERYDPEGEYIRTYVPELSKLPAKWIHKPFEAPEDVLQAAGVELGVNYPLPIVDHKAARIAALEALSDISG